ncbi:N,N'-diacetylchitobiose phosphorylase [Butyrivibrio sp. CB08]|uniref:GH36-type glycosyl hydrolase domain-containing protein n=1 Tax=Butyrivibrio sp. CB08 TaxID=2364879 RepID=UPI000EA91E5C|nr:N,N'-diacetylchitobiose phosphorylase [Butyrivibrio sp. CB08]RKM60599.1 N,N'-diacetylchitobiose phosphorylase [Butyrivibrio sp. CB08]
MKYGYFDRDNDEYVIDRVDIPTSWTNYLGVEDMCAVVNHTAGGYLFYRSPEYHRITRFRGNAVPMDRPGDYVYIRDREDGDFFSISWQPVGKPLDKARYICRHGMSVTTYECDYNGIHASQKMSIPLGDNALVWDVNITNTSDRKRELDVFTYAEFSFHHVMIDNQNFQMSLYCAGSEYQDGAIVHDLYYEEEGYQYFTANFEPDGYECLRDQFIGTYNTETNPKAVIEGRLSGGCEKGGNHCASLQKALVLEPGQSARLLFFLGEGSYKEAKEIREKYADPAALDRAYDALKAFWKNKQDSFRVSSPEAGVDTMINTWTLYQSEINVMFSRFASFIEVGGRTGLGYRDTAQDAMTVIPSNPAGCKKRIVELLRALTTWGYGIHLFEPRWFAPEDEKENKKKPFKSPTVIPEPEGSSKVHTIADACADDALWLVPTITEYVKETGDAGFLGEKYGYADGGCGTVYDHMKKIVEFSIKEVGSHGICKGLRADWNDCLNLGGGESALVSFLLYKALTCMIEISDYLGLDEERDRYVDKLNELQDGLDKVLWDGDWYLRGFTKNGRKIGSKENKEGKIHLESNAWAVLSGAANEDRSRKTLDSIYEHLFTPFGIMLNGPAYTEPDDDIGFVARVYPGLKENASIFSHPNPWVWSAECRVGNGNRAFEYYKSLCPYYQNDKIEIRQAEPYSYCQFISGKDHTTYGRAHHPFMTGSGGWAYFAVTHYLLGLRPEFDELVVDPCIPAAWDGFNVKRRFRGDIYNVTVENPAHVQKGVKEIWIDGRITDRIKAIGDGKEHEVRVVMG